MIANETRKDRKENEEIEVRDTKNKMEWKEKFAF